MRGTYITFFVLALTFSINVWNEIDQTYYGTYDRYLLNKRVEPMLNTSYLEGNINDTIEGLGVNEIPTQNENTIIDLFTGAGYMGALKGTYDFLINTNVRFGYFLKDTFFPDMPQALAIGISAFVFVNNILLIFAILGRYLT